MKKIDFCGWSQRDSYANIMTGGGFCGADARAVTVDGAPALEMVSRKTTAHRIKIKDALEDTAQGNEYRICVKLRLGETCTANEANLVVGVSELMALSPAFYNAPVLVTKDDWATVAFTHTLADASHDTVSIEQSGKDKQVAEHILIADLCTELITRAPKNEEVEDTRTTLWLIGDSITCSYVDKSTTKGWGQYIGEWFDETRIKVCNKARAGLSTESFINTDGLAIWMSVCERMKAGDHLIVSLGINDFSSSSPERRVEKARYEENLCAFAEAAKQRGVSLLFVTSTVTVDRNPIENYRRSYPESMIKIATEKKAEGYDIYALDLNAAMLEAMKEIVAEKGFEYLVDTYFSDNTHHKESGSRWVISMIVDLLRQSESPLKAFLK